MQIDNFKVYDSGFLGSLLNSDKQSQNAEVVGAIPSNVQVIKDKQTSGFYNKTLSDLYKKYMTKSHDCLTFEFQELYLAESLLAFGTNDFHKWVLTQSESPFYTTEHQNFLYDTIKFIVTGTRRMNAFDWKRVVIPKVGEKILFKYTDEARVLFNPAETWRPAPIEKIVQKWLSYPNGWEDYLNSLNIFFGLSDTI